jgi:hypothetical protein
MISTTAVGGTPRAAHKRAYTAAPSAQSADSLFVATYSGSGRFHTRFHATPPNPGGKPDTNDAWDSSTQSWALEYRGAVHIPTCGAAAEGGADPCDSLTAPTSASGPTALVGRVRHRHVDGLYRELDRKVKCQLAKRPSPHSRLDASIVLRYIPEADAIGVSATDPVATAVSLFPAQCPKQGDSIDRILDFYAMPGFSFADGYGPERWFASREVVIPEAVFHRSKKITIPLRDTRAGAPPKHCAVHDPSFERCTVTGSWSGTLTLTSTAKR